MHETFEGAFDLWTTKGDTPAVRARDEVSDPAGCGRSRDYDYAVHASERNRVCGNVWWDWENREMSRVSVWTSNARLQLTGRCSRAARKESRGRGCGWTVGFVLCCHPCLRFCPFSFLNSRYRFAQRHPSRIRGRQSRDVLFATGLRGRTWVRPVAAKLLWREWLGRGEMFKGPGAHADSSGCILVKEATLGGTVVTTSII
ncbi:hypothetical protein LXA43DRAFT_1025835 [Ganoderma leucocontextum]|nr:hypothetical protein LXA43DRAFT_1025835 [Ganoderma leucocontextum]